MVAEDAELRPSLASVVAAALHGGGQLICPTEGRGEEGHDDGDQSLGLTGTDLTLACACLARTCFSLTDAESVTISSEGLGFVSMTLTRSSLLLVDETPIPTE